MKYLLSLCIIIFITALFVESSPAFPTTATTASPTYSATQPQTTAATGRLELSELCKGKPLGEDLLTSEAMVQATLKALRQVSVRTRQSIDRCVIYTPTEKSYFDESKINYLDESIDEFNSDRPWEETTNTAFLLVGVGMKSEPVSAGEDCASKRPVIAGSHDDLPSVLPGSWLEHFQVKETIHLKAGQMLIGVPLDRSDGSLADGYFAALMKKIEYKHDCRDGGWSWSRRYHHNSEKVFFKGELIHFNGAGILITGLTTLPALDAFMEDAGKHCEADSKVITTASHEVYTEMLKGELNLKSLKVPANGYMANIFRNEFFQILKPAISLSLADESENVDSALFTNRTLVGFSNNQVYSCYNKKNPVETAVDINLTYRDTSPRSEFIRAIEFKDNYILGNAPKAMNLALPEHVTVSIVNSEFVTTKVSDVNAKGISIHGPDQSSEDWRAPLTVDMTGNLIRGYQAALSLTGYQKLVLKSNQLLGELVSIERRNDLTLPVTLSGDSNNQFNALGNDPCHQLEHTNIIGGFVFSDGITSCPGSFTHPTMFTSSFRRLFSSIKSITSATTTHVNSGTPNPLTSGFSLSTESALKSILTSSEKNLKGTSSPTHSTPFKKRSNNTKDKISKGRNARLNDTKPGPSPARNLPTHSQSLVTELKPTYNNSTPASLEFSDGRRGGSSSGFKPWQKALTVVGGVLVFAAGIAAITYYKVKNKRSPQKEPLIDMKHMDDHLQVMNDPLAEL
ncbi:hypothetical protein [Endozoicomonas sp. ONNA1]|uniref:hypothetical protein n=1 Tax=Endozoicomonas sp. ONNA1 TaxID=2828740 RepID=UPI00214941D4|nr:hypothetical protein [Endozoicomonas sp. ONNA1]